MKNALIGLLVVLGLVVAFSVWLYETIGWLGLGVLAAAAVYFIFLVNKSQRQKSQQNIDDLALYVMNTQSHWTEEKKLNNALSRSNPSAAELIRNLQIIRESITIALTSKKRETAESGMKGVLSCYKTIEERLSHVVSPHVFEEITNRVKSAENDFHTKLYINIAAGHVAKAEKLKTKRSKEKYLELALASLDEGLKSGLGHDHELEGEFLKVEEKKRQLLAEAK
jgi:hypothetical protein